jgi:2-dehydropantoate 2-reductase
MRWVIVGPGALGSVFGATLAKAAHDVAMLGRSSPALDALRNGGVSVNLQDGTITRFRPQITDDPAVIAGAEVILVLVKAYDTLAAMRSIRPHVRNEHVILTLQNGLGNAERIRSVLGDTARILTGVTSQAATRTGPDTVIHAGEGPTIIGPLACENVPAAAELAAVVSAAGLPTAAVTDIERWIWQKVAVNAAINGLTALGGFPNGTIVDDPGLLDAAEIIGDEAADVARTLGFELGGTRRAIAETAAATATNRSSMLQDLEAGRPTEVEAIHGAIVAAGHAAGIATPVNQVLAAVIRAKARAERQVNQNG